MKWPEFIVFYILKLSLFSCDKSCKNYRHTFHIVSVASPALIPFIIQFYSGWLKRLRPRAYTGFQARKALSYRLIQTELCIPMMVLTKTWMSFLCIMIRSVNRLVYVVIPCGVTPLYLYSVAYHATLNARFVYDWVWLLDDVVIICELPNLVCWVEISILIVQKTKIYLYLWVS